MLLAVAILTLLSWPLALGPLLKLASTSDWVARECTIVASERKESSGGKPTRSSWSWVLRYTFDINGQAGTGSAINVTDLDGGLPIRAGARRGEIQPDYALGSLHPCWVDPEPPHSAVLERQVTMLPWFLSSVLALLGVAAVASVAHGR